LPQRHRFSSRAAARASTEIVAKVDETRRRGSSRRVTPVNQGFRDANEKIAKAASEYERVEQVPFICECATESCTVIVRLSLAEYEEVRSAPTRFFVAPGHQASEGVVSILEDREGYVVLEKKGRAGEVATELDPRSDS